MMFKSFMKWMILMTIMITLSSNNWFIFWLMMEMNLLMFIPLMNSKKKNNSNCMISYFIVQSFSSTLFFLSNMCFFLINIYFFKLGIMISIMIKLAVIPFHFWLTNLSEMMNYYSLFIILTFQKFIPLFILVSINMKILIIFAMISSFFGSLFTFNLKSLKKILIFSSISHQGWLMTLLTMKSNFWFTYMIIYSILIFKIMTIFEKNNFNYINSLFKNKLSMSEKINISSLMLSLGGMPPFLGFLMKFISILIIIKISIIIMSILILSSMINIYIYMRMMNINFFLNNIFFNKAITFKNKFKNMFLNLNLFFSMFIMNMILL
uniref:NADH dehydrogenase subunit 2 n=1 Tax=Amblyomma nitidum TaxID=1325864 RepID=UPI0030FE7413